MDFNPKREEESGEDADKRPCCLKRRSHWLRSGFSGIKSANGKQLGTLSRPGHLGTYNALLAIAYMSTNLTLTPQQSLPRDSRARSIRVEIVAPILTQFLRECPGVRLEVEALDSTLSGLPGTFFINRINMYYTHTHTYTEKESGSGSGPIFHVILFFEKGSDRQGDFIFININQMRMINV